MRAEVEALQSSLAMLDGHEGETAFGDGALKGARRGLIVAGVIMLGGTHTEWAQRCRTNFFEYGRRNGTPMDQFAELFHWVVAMDAFDYCDTEPLTSLLESSEPIPGALRPSLARIISGSRTPNKKAAAKLKIPAAERMVWGALLDFELAVAGLPVGKARWPYHANEAAMFLDFVSMQADEESREPIQVFREVRRQPQAIITRYATDKLGVSVDTIKKEILGAYRRKRDAFPNV